MRINQVVRGADLLQSTARQILLFEALGFPIPTFAHVPLLLDEHGKRFSKRAQSAGLEPLRAGGATPEQVVGQLAADCGLADGGKQLSARSLAQRYKEDGYDVHVNREPLTSSLRSAMLMSSKPSHKIMRPNTQKGT
jgi:glutamyl-tRNA synthetase